MKILITGSHGFIGSILSKRLLMKGHDVKFMDLKHIVIPMDILNFFQCNLATDKIDAVCHLAAKISVSESISNPKDYLDTNVGGFNNIIEASRQNGIKRFVYASSAAVENKTKSPYAISKSINEECASMYSECYNMETIGLRFYNVYEDKISNDRSDVISNFHNYKNKGLPLEIYGDGSQIRDFVHISDVIDSLELALTTKNKDCFGNVYPIGSGVSTHIIDIAKNISKNVTFVEKREGDVKNSISNLTQSKKDLGYTPKFRIIP